MSGKTYIQQNYFDASTCSDQPTLINVLQTADKKCTPIACISGDKSTADGLSASASCPASTYDLPKGGPNYVVVVEYGGSSQCLGDPVTTQATIADGVCHKDGNGTYVMATCDNGKPVTKFCRDAACETDCEVSPKAGCTGGAGYSTDVYCHLDRPDGKKRGKRSGDRKTMPNAGVGKLLERSYKGCFLLGLFVISIALV